MKSKRRVIPIISRFLETDSYADCTHWAFENRILPPSNAISGQFDTEAVSPFLLDVARALANPKYKIVSLSCGSQMGKTELGFNFIGHAIDENGQPCLIAVPTQKLAEKMSKTRFKFLIKTSPSLNRKLKTGSSDNILLKEIGNAYLLFGYAKASQLCSDAVAKAYVDEYDRFPDDIDDEGDPLELIEVRTQSYTNAKIFVSSTPTILGLSKIDNIKKDSNHLQCHLICPSCKKPTIVNFAQLRYNVVEENIVDHAYIECEHCQHEIDDNYKPYMEQKKNLVYLHINEETGEKSTEDQLPFNEHISFFVSGMLSPFKKIKGLAQKWVKALASGNEKKKKAVMNTGFGEPYELEGESLGGSEVRACIRNYHEGRLQTRYKDAIILTVDVQKESIYYVVRGWSKNGQSALVEKGQIFGDTKENAIWNKLKKLASKRYSTYKIDYVLIDSNYRSGKVYEFCKKNGKKFKPCIGRPRQNIPINATPVQININGKKVKYGLVVFTFLEGHFKELLIDGIREGVDWFLPKDIEEEYIKQLCSEKLVVDGDKEKWVKEYENHYLDCEKMQYVAADIFRIDLAGEEETEGFKEEEAKPPKKMKIVRNAQEGLNVGVSDDNIVFIK